MKVSLLDVDGHNFPNLALMKLSAWHKLQGDDVDWYQPLFSRPDRLYASKVFTFTPEYDCYAASDPEPIRGGTGYDASIKLPDEVENILPDYSIYPEFTQATGFLTRGCIRSCPWCIVPKKEGSIHIVDDISRICVDRKEVVLLDNNFLAAPEAFVQEQLEKSQRLKLKLDFNQALDARMVNEKNAPLLAATRWSKYIRFACDTASMLPYVQHAVELIRAHKYRGDFFIYVLAKDLNETLERIIKLTSFDRRIIPFCQPYRDFISKTEPPEELQQLARWCNRQAIRKSIPFSEYRYKSKQ